MTLTRTLPRRAALTVATATAALVLAACGGGHEGHGSSSSASSSSPGSARTHNDQDVVFAQGMIPHHRQALEMAALAADRASSAQVVDLAARIEKAQDPEIRTLTGWLEAWGEAVPEAGATDHSSHSGMAGMMDEADMEKLEKASGKAFDTAFLAMMVEHHEGAVAMARTEQDKGRHGPAKEMAGDIVTGQQAEIEEMNELLGKQGGEG
ncbi:DUF305 domain-containing protein [Streptomyces sp. NPDC052016]|uniref:DUF305 domain-containing protein n=1 Tax=Streptomyces sp. NPDC052016 TaxID=3365680 RepID=UPI0037D353BD